MHRIDLGHTTVVGDGGGRLPEHQHTTHHTINGKQK